LYEDNKKIKKILSSEMKMG